MQDLRKDPAGSLLLFLKDLAFSCKDPAGSFKSLQGSCKTTELLFGPKEVAAIMARSDGEVSLVTFLPQKWLEISFGLGFISKNAR